MNQEHTRETKIRRTPLLLLSVSLLLAALLFSGLALAGEISVSIPDEELIDGQTYTLPVVLHDADNINGYQIIISEHSGAAAVINPDADHVAGTRFNSDNTKAVLVSTATPLNGDVTLFCIDVTPVSGKNVILNVEVYEIMNTNDEGIDDGLDEIYPGKETIIPVTGGTTERITEPEKETDIFSSLSTEREPTKKSRSPGFLPITILGGTAAAGYLLIRRKQ